MECTIHRLLDTTLKHISVSDTETCFCVHSFDRDRFFECITHRVHVPTRKHISMSDTETCFRVLPVDCTEFLSAQLTDGSSLAVALRSGDYLLFNAREPHCLSSRCREDDQIYSISCDLKTSVVSWIK